MEQRMENEKVTPVTGAGFDPAHIPGLTPPVGEQESEEATKAAEPAREVTPEPEEPEEPTREESPEASAEKEPDTEGPVLEAKDRRGSITVDASGVRFTLDDQEAEFTWDEISAVEFGTTRKRLTVTVHMPNSRWFPNDVEAPDKARLNEWTDQLDKALDTYFEE
ncbi:MULTISPECIES: hypothetical protein [unclassified Streptomyces]|uniref:hypothetical protein n=1 Tax=unclassified Streptomyces TaxID=2593676 RepID=UPI003BB5156E